MMLDLDADQLDRGDVDRNGETNIIDVTYIQRYEAFMDTVPGIGETF